LGGFLEDAEVSLASSEDQNFKGLVLVQDLFPFVRELADSLLINLESSIDSPSLACPLLTNIGDFTAFLVPVRTGIEQHQALQGCVPYHKLDRNGLVVEEIEYLHLLYNQMLCKIDTCLQKMEKRFFDKEMVHEENYFYPACSLYLSLLKELHNLSKLYDGAPEKLRGVLMRQKTVMCLMIVKYAKRADEHQWILEHKNVTNFETRRHLAMMIFPEVKEDYEELHEMLIDRSQLLTESFEYIARADPESLRAGLFMEFKNEEATGPGVLREWFLLVCQAIFNQANALFVACPNDRTRFLPNSASKVHPLHLEYFCFCGRVIALALMHSVQVGIVFDRTFFLQLAGNPITLEDIREADPALYKSCKQILDMDSDFIDSDALGLTFVREVEELGHRKAVELCTGGKNIVVNSKNRVKYVDLLIKDRFVTAISEQVSHFSKGFADILSCSKLQQFFFRSLEPEDLDYMLRGSEDGISIEDWKAHTEYNGYKETDIQISWFWEIVGRMTAEEKKVLLFFWTSVKYLPVEGFCGLSSRLHIYKSHEPCNRLPSSHTCFHRLCFPVYPSMPVMEARLKVITQEHIGSSFGTW
jgi:E3 ubiquitin-protein ligase NEDD4